MKTTFLLLLFILTSCSTEPIETSNNSFQKEALQSQSTVSPVLHFHGVLVKSGNKRYITFSWGSSYNLGTFTNTIKRNGVVLATNYLNVHNQFQIEIPRNYQATTYSCSQTVNGITSAESFTIR